MHLAGKAKARPPLSIAAEHAAFVMRFYAERLSGIAAAERSRDAGDPRVVGNMLAAAEDLSRAARRLEREGGAS